jgi:hypothetical protein
MHFESASRWESFLNRRYLSATVKHSNRRTGWPERHEIFLVDLPDPICMKENDKQTILHVFIDYYETHVSSTTPHTLLDDLLDEADRERLRKIVTCLVEKITESASSYFEEQYGSTQSELSRTHFKVSMFSSSSWVDKRHQLMRRFLYTYSTLLKSLGALWYIFDKEVSSRRSLAWRTILSSFLQKVQSDMQNMVHQRVAVFQQHIEEFQVFTNCCVELGLLCYIEDDPDLAMYPV